jgi:FlaA1/EpsC-like NDP-sugar epimerase
VLGTRNLVEQAVCSRVARFVQISTDKAVRPTSIMGASKRVCEMIVQSQKHQHHTRFRCVRFGNVLGSRGSVLPIFQEQIRHGGPVIVTHPEAQRFLMTIPEAVSLLIQAGTLASAGEIFLLDMGKPVLIGNLARDLIELSGLRPGKDVEIQITQLRPGEKLAEELLDDNTEKLLPTQFPKIRMISRLAFETNIFWKQVRDLEQAARQERADEIYRLLGEMNIGFCHAVTPLTRLPVPLPAPRVAAAGV